MKSKSVAAGELTPEDSVDTRLASPFAALDRHLLQSFRNAYERVNWAGQWHGTVMEPTHLATRISERARSPHRLVGLVQPAPPVARFTRAAGEMARLFGENLQMSFAYNLTYQRTLPFLWIQPGGFVPLGRYRWTVPLYPLAELVVGRGHTSNAIPRLFFGKWTSSLAPWARFHQTASQMGVLGLLLEQAPLRAANACEAAGHRRVATACMATAVLGRLLLQAPRMAMAAAAAVDASCSTILWAAVLIALHVGLRLTQSACAHAHHVLGRDILGATQGVDKAIRWLEHQRESWIRDLLPPTSAANPPVDNGSDGVPGRVLARARQLFVDFQPIARRQAHAPVDSADEAQQLRQVAESIAADLRLYCRQLETDEALMGALSELRAAIAWAWDIDAVEWLQADLRAEAPASSPR